MCIIFPFYVVLGIELMALWVLVRYGTHGLMCVSWVWNPWPHVCVSEAFYQLSSGSSPSLLFFSWGPRACGLPAFAAQGLGLQIRTIIISSIIYIKNMHFVESFLLMFMILRDTFRFPLSSYVHFGRYSDCLPQGHLSPLRNALFVTQHL